MSIHSSIHTSIHPLAAFTSAMVLATPLAAQNVIAPDDLVKIALVNLELIDKRNTASVWNEASPVFKRRVSREAFDMNMVQTRPMDAGALARSWTHVSRFALADGNPAGWPGGIYARVNFLARTSAGKILNEQVGFRLEPDQRWRLTAYQVDAAR